MKREYRCLFACVFIVMMAGCSTLKVSDDPTRQIAKDPFQNLNRSIYAFNNGVDSAVLRPVAKAYTQIVPKSAQNGVGRFFANLAEPLNALNNLLQGKFDRALVSTYRFTVNSTLGIFGFMDVAKSLDVEPAKEDFGQTLASWGVPPGPYLMLPFWGPSNLRDFSGNLIDASIFYPINQVTDSSNGRLALFAVDKIEIRAKLLGTDTLINKQLDPYGFIKQALEQNRTNAIYDGHPPELEEDF